MSSSYFVDPIAGDDENGGLSPQTPFRTIAHASDHLSPGDRLRLHAGRSSARQPRSRPASRARRRRPSMSSRTPATGSSSTAESPTR